MGVVAYRFWGVGANIFMRVYCVLCFISDTSVQHLLLIRSLDQMVLVHCIILYIQFLVYAGIPYLAWSCWTSDSFLLFPTVDP